jgi:hypothetical protein
MVSVFEARAFSRRAHTGLRVQMTGLSSNIFPNAMVSTQDCSLYPNN